MPGAQREPGWYPDRNDPAYNRYWNGRAWTARRHPAGQPPPAIQRPGSEGPPPQAGDQTAPAGPKARIPIWMWVIGALLVARSLVGVVAAFHDQAPGSTGVTNPHTVVAPSRGTGP